MRHFFFLSFWSFASYALAMTGLSSPCVRSMVPWNLKTLEKLGIERVLQEGKREPFARIKKLPGTKHNPELLEVTSPNGAYTFEIVNDPKLSYPSTGLPEISILPNHIKGHLKIYEFENPARVENLIRALFVADNYLHPLQVPPTATPWQTILALPQQSVIDQLIEMESWPGSENQNRRAIVMPVAAGKTLLAAHYVKHLHRLFSIQRRTIQPPKVLFVVEDGTILEDAARTFSRELGYTKIAKVFAQKLRNETLTADYEMIVITRSGYHNRLSEIQALLNQRRNQPWVTIFDEGHHTGKSGGQFDDIIHSLDNVRGPYHRQLYLSATLWHEDKRIIQNDLHGYVAAAFLKDSELETLRSGNNLVELCRSSHVRGVQRGYFPPIHGLNVVRDRSFLDLFTFAGIRSVPERRRKEAVGPVIEALYEQIIKQRVPNLTDRGIFFAPSTEHADLFNEILQETIHRNHDSALSYSYHGKQKAKDNAQALLQFRSPSEQHQYFFVVDMLGEGTDLPQTNLVAFMKTFGGTANSFRVAEQNMGRMGRAHLRKPFQRIIDMGDFAPFILSDLASISVERLYHDTTGPHLRSPVSMNGNVIEASEATSAFYEFFPSDDTFHLRFPYFDATTFRNGALRVLLEEAPHFGFGAVNGEGVLQSYLLALIEKLPESDEKDALRQRVKNETWPANFFAEAMSGRDSAARRIYEIYHLIAALQFYYFESVGFTFERLTSAEDCYQVLGKLSLHYVRPLDSYDAKTTFLSESEGALKVLREWGEENGITYFNRDFGAKKAIVALMKHPKLKRASNLKAWVEAISNDSVWGWTAQDARPMEISTGRLPGSQPGNRERFQRIYRALVVLARLANEVAPDLHIDLSRIHTREETLRLLRFFHPDCLAPEEAPLPKPDVIQAFQQSGIDPFIKSTSQFGVRALANDMGLRDLLSNWAMRLRESPKVKAETKKELSQLIEMIQHDDSVGGAAGARLRRSQKVATDTYTYLRALADSAIKIYPEYASELQNLHEPRAMQALRDIILVGFPIPEMSPDDRARWMSKENEIVRAIIQQSARFGVDVISTDFGLKTLISNWGEKVLGQKTPTKEDRFAIEMVTSSNWGWQKGDGSVISTGEPASLDRLYRALYVLYKIQGNTLEESIQPCATQSYYQFADRLSFGFILPHITEDALSAFRDTSDGSWRALIEATAAHGLTGFTVAPKEAILFFANGLSEKNAEQKRNKLALIAALRNDRLWGWVPSDGSQVQAGEYWESSARKIYRALVAMAFIQSLSEKKWEEELHSLPQYSTTSSLLDELRPQP